MLIDVLEYYLDLYSIRPSLSHLEGIEEDTRYYIDLNQILCLFQFWIRKVFILMRILQDYIYGMIETFLRDVILEKLIKMRLQ